MTIKPKVRKKIVDRCVDDFVRIFIIERSSESFRRVEASKKFKIKRRKILRRLRRVNHQKKFN